MNVAQRQKIERQIIKRIVDDAISAGLQISVEDGEDITLRQSTDAKAIMAAVMTTDEDRLLIHQPGVFRPFAWVYLIYGNDGWDVVNDHSTNITQLLAGATELAERLEKQHA